VRERASPRSENPGLSCLVVAPLFALIPDDVERRRRWSEEDRARILAEIEASGAVVAEVARRADICTSLIYKWRHDARKSASVGASGFPHVVIEASPSHPAASAGERDVILVEVKDARVRIGAIAPSALSKAEPGAVVAEVARRADVCTSLVYKWRREARAAASASGFAQLVVENPPQPTTPTSASEREPGAIVVEMKDARIRIGANAPTALIAATLKALRF
jgi:transposase